VSFPEDRDVLADGDRVGVTNHTILITANEYTITATTQNNLGTALSTLGERESGTARLEQAVVAYNGAIGIVPDSSTGYYETIFRSNRAGTIALIENRRSDRRPPQRLVS
jgi:hypothetical protein